MIPVFSKKLRISPKTILADLSRDERAYIIDILKGGFAFDIRSTKGMQQAMITRGGVRLGEIDPKTMASKLIKGLYFAGEIIDLDADTGGFNMQAAFSTGYLAGASASSLGPV
jgi:hypothetical protein